MRWREITRRIVLATFGGLVATVGVSLAEAVFARSASGDAAPALGVAALAIFGLIGPVCVGLSFLLGVGSIALMPDEAPSLSGWLARLRALGTALRALTPTIDAEFGTDPELPAELRWRFELLADGAVLAVGSEELDGLARCRVTPRAACPRSLRGLLQRFGYEATTGWLSIDVPAVTGNLTSQPRDGGPLDETLMLAALDCGELALFARASDDGGWRLTARSDAGLLLPALLMLLAEPTDSAGLDDLPSLGDDLDRWLLMARASQHAEREEALRQLGRFEDPRAIEALEHTLFDPELCDVAALALAHLGSPEALAALGRHAARLDPDLAADGIWAALPVGVRARIRARIAAESASTTSMATTPLGAPTAGGDWLHDLRLAAGGLAVGLLVAWLLVRQRLAAA